MTRSALRVQPRLIPRTSLSYVCCLPQHTCLQHGKTQQTPRKPLVLNPQKTLAKDCEEQPTCSAPNFTNLIAILLRQHFSKTIMDAESRPEERKRSRSRSPRRSPPRKPKNFSGLKYKNDRDSERRRDPDRDRERRPRDSDRDRERRPRDSDRDRERRPREDRDRDRRRDSRDRERRPREDRDRRPHSRDRKPRDREPKEKKPAAAAAAPASGEAYIIVTVNDRLGTKTQVPCLPSDPVKVLKAMVAAQIGRPVHEIMLKRQGERPFLDQLSLADYAISNGVQIDLELNTGD